MSSLRETILSDVRRWLSSVVVGLQLCPFAKPVISANKARLVVCEAHQEDELTRAFLHELEHLLQTPPETLSTTLLIVPFLLEDFDTYLDTLAFAEDILEDVGLSGIFQIASFHPKYRFEGSHEDDLANWTNRSPYPIFHLLREAEITALVEAGVDTEAIPERNVRLLRSLPEEERLRLFPWFRPLPASAKKEGENETPANPPKEG